MQNPYPLERGFFETNDQIPINGYGITLASLKHFLFQNQLNTEMVTIKKQLPKYETLNDETINNYIDQISPHFEYLEIEYDFEDDPYLFTGLIYQNPNPTINQQIIPSEYDLELELHSIINDIYQVPDQYYDQLQTFIQKYADYISFVANNQQN